MDLLIYESYPNQRLARYIRCALVCALDSSRQNHVEPANTSEPEFECSYMEVWRINCTGLQTNLKTSDSHHNWKAWNENSECFKILTCVLFYSVIKVLKCISLGFRTTNFYKTTMYIHRNHLKYLESLIRWLSCFNL